MHKPALVCCKGYGAGRDLECTTAVQFDRQSPQYIISRPAIHTVTALHALQPNSHLGTLNQLGRFPKILHELGAYR